MRAVFSRTGFALKTACLLAGLLILPSAVSANEAAIEVVMNQAKIVKLSQAASTVIIGNPEIADATVRDAQTRKHSSASVFAASPPQRSISLSECHPRMFER